jgi:hypothetical protein
MSPDGPSPAPTHRGPPDRGRRARRRHGQRCATPEADPRPPYSTAALRGDDGRCGTDDRGSVVIDHGPLICVRGESDTVRREPSHQRRPGGGSAVVHQRDGDVGRVGAAVRPSREATGGRSRWGGRPHCDGTAGPMACRVMPGSGSTMGGDPSWPHQRRSSRGGRRPTRSMTAQLVGAHRRDLHAAALALSSAGCGSPGLTSAWLGAVHLSAPAVRAPARPGGASRTGPTG